VHADERPADAIHLASRMSARLTRFMPPP
jgi:hypothetical protein